MCSSLASQTSRPRFSYADDAPCEAEMGSCFLPARLALAPQCLVFPESASDVSRIVRLSVGMEAKAAVRGGGHMPIVSVADINNGGTIDLIGIKAVNL